MPREHLLKIGVSGVRGVVGDFLTPGLALAFAHAFGTYVGRGRVVVGRDTRTSGPMLQHAVASGLLAAGCEVIDVGVMPTPTIQLYIAHTGAKGGICLTASHNPPEYNALKLFNKDGFFFNHYERSELIDLYHQSNLDEAQNHEIRQVRREGATAQKIHSDRALSFVDVDLIRSKNFRVALDSVNGAGSVMSPGFLTNQLGCKLHAIAIDPTTVFSRIAEPRPDTLGDLSELVKRTGAAIGFAQDPDGDRLAVVDERGEVLDNDDVLALVVKHVLPRFPGDVVVNLTTSSVMEDLAAAQGRRVFRTAVGEANVVDMMLAVKCAIGGEGSNGGVIFPSVHYCRDSYTGMAFLLELLAQTGQTVSSLVAALPRYYRKLGKVTFEHGRLGNLMQALEEHFPEAATDRSDGLKLIWPDGWIHVRASNTEPLLRLAAEARSAQRMEDLYDQVTVLLS